MFKRFAMRLLPPAALLLAVVAGWLISGSNTAKAGDYCGPSSRPDLFYNFYVAPVPCNPAGAVGAELYPCPLPTPPLVGHTYITYQPLLPQEFMYRHHRCYYRDNGPYAGVTRTYVCWW
jgi:hypothetical protein